MAEQQMIELLNGLTASDTDKRTQATKMYKDAKEKNPDELVITLMKVVAVAGAAAADKKSALVYLRQLMNKERSEEFIFPKLQEANKQAVASGLLELFEKEEDEKVQISILNTIDALACYTCDPEDPRGWLVQGQSVGWPTLMPTCLRLANCQSNPKMHCVKSAFKLLKGLVPTIKDEFVRLTAEIGQVLQIALASPALAIKTVASLLIMEMVETFDKKDWAPLTATLPVIVQVCTQLAQQNETSDLEDILQGFVSVAGIEADFFKNAMTQHFQPAEFLSGVVKSKEADNGLRNLALEWITTYAEKKPKFLVKSVPKFTQAALESCMAMMLEIEDGESELKEWAGRMDDEEGEEDSDELYWSGEESMDRISEALTMEAISGTLFPLIATFSQQQAWQAKHAALATVKQVVEYVEEEAHMAEMANLLMAHVNHAHPRVRYTALHAIGQLANDQAPLFQEKFHAQIMPLLMTAMDDKVDRVAAMAMSAFVSFAEEMKDILHTYSHSFMEKFLSRLQSSQHRGIQEESITAIAVIAAVVGKDFKQYYGNTMPLLKQLIISCTGEKQQRLRGKAFECLSLLGAAVGKEQFLPDCRQAIEAMLTTKGAVDEIQGEYIKEAIQRISHCLKKDFAQFLPQVMPGIFSSLNAEQEAGLIPKGTGNADQDDVFDVTVNGKMMKVKSSKTEEMHQAASMLNSFIGDMEEAFFDYVQPTAQALLPIIKMTGDAATIFEDARGEAFETWGLLVKASSKGAQARGMPTPSPLVAELLKTIVAACVELLKHAEGDGEDVDLEEVGYYAYGMQTSIKEAGPGYIAAQEAGEIVQLMFMSMDKSFRRSEKIKAHMKNQTAGAPVELQGDEDDEDQDPLGDERTLRQTYEATLGAVMKANPEAFSQSLDVCSQRMQGWLSTKEELVLGLHFACDMLEYLKDKSCPIWPMFMPKIFEAIGHKDAEARIAAAYAVNLASAVPQFSEAAPQAYKLIAQVVGGKAPKKRDEQAKAAMDNAVAALFGLARNMPAQCPPDVNAFGLVISKLPMKGDLEEAKKVHLLVAQLLQQQHTGLIGANQENLGKVLSVLAEIHSQEDTSTEEIDALILQIFKALPMEVIQKSASCFSEKQQKRIEKLLSA